MWTEVDECRGRVGTGVDRCLLKYTLVLVCISFFNLGDINCHSLFVRFGIAIAIRVRVTSSVATQSIRCTH